MGRSNPDPVLRRTPGARFTTTLLAGSEKPHERSAAFTRSRDSCSEEMCIRDSYVIAIGFGLLLVRGHVVGGGLPRRLQGLVSQASFQEVGRFYAVSYTHLGHP